MAKKRKPPELTFQQHIADYLVREHKYAILLHPVTACIRGILAIHLPTAYR
jgi:hypothetical protein